MLIGVVTGWKATGVIREYGMGRTGNIVLRVTGAVVSGFLFDHFWPWDARLLGSLISSFFGAVALLALLKTVRQARDK